MHDHNTTLKILFELVKESSNPTHYSCQLSEIIARHDQGWDSVIADLKALSTDELIVYATHNAIMITQKGIETVTSIGSSIPHTAHFDFLEKVA